MQTRILGAFILALAALLAPEAEAQLKIGDPAPEFALQAANRDTILYAGIRLSEARSKTKVILAFYPADWSSGCTKEMCAMRDSFADLATLNASVLGISGDYVYSHHEWAKELNLPFTLLSDHDHAVAKAYGSYKAERGFNRRTVFVVDTSGTITYIDLEYKVSTPDSFDRLRKALR